MARISKIATPILPEAKSIERQAHEAWVQYFNSHKLFLRSSADEFVPGQTGITQGGIGFDTIRNRTTFAAVKGEMMSAFRCYKNGNKKQCKAILDALSHLNTDFDVRMTFFKMLAEMQ